MLKNDSIYFITTKKTEWKLNEFKMNSKGKKIFSFIYYPKSGF
jgi:hypothetical protein